MENSVLYSKKLESVGNGYLMETYTSLRNVLQCLNFFNGRNSRLTGSHGMKTCNGESWAHKGSIKQLVMFKKRATLKFKGFYIKKNMACLLSLRVGLPPVSGIRHL